MPNVYTRPPCVFVYMTEADKGLVERVASATGMSQSAVLQALAIPQLSKLDKLIRQGKARGVEAYLRKRLPA